MKVLNGLDLQARKISNLADPTLAQDAATKAYVDSLGGGGGGGGLTQIGSTLTVTSGASTSFTSIPASYACLLLEILGLSHDNGANQQLQIELSPDGSTWTATSLISAPIAASGTLYGNVLIPGYARGAGSLDYATALMPADNALVAGSSVTSRVWRMSGGIKALRLSWTGSANFDATGTGQLKLYGF